MKESGKFLYIVEQQKLKDNTIITRTRKQNKTKQKVKDKEGKRARFFYLVGCQRF